MRDWIQSSARLVNRGLKGASGKKGKGNLRWILVQWADTAVHNAKGPHLSEFYW